DAVGIDARDAVWQHPDLLPSSADLDEPAGFIDRIVGGDTSGLDIDTAIAEFQKAEDEKKDSESEDKKPKESGDDDK
ncbi:MAG: zinc-dependent metalloprotease, partial [Mycolicibacterium aromaticivorans]|nr:zinc-dependent metalloprotease [Mycolicibacterium aromaticivorans]